MGCGGVGCLWIDERRGRAVTDGGSGCIWDWGRRDLAVREERRRELEFLEKVVVLCTWLPVDVMGCEAW